MVMETETGTHEWERQPGETYKAYEAFRIFLSAEPPRYIRELWIKQDPSRELKLHCMWTDWSSRWDWISRAAAYDDYNRRRVQKEVNDAMLADILAFEKEKLASKRESLALARMLRERAADVLAHKLAGETRTVEKVNEEGELVSERVFSKVRWTLGDAAKLAAAADGLVTSATEGIEDDMTRALPDHYRQVIMGDEAITPDSVQEIQNTVREINDALSKLQQLSDGHRDDTEEITRDAPETVQTDGAG